jgi:flagellar basal-body rod modification protein FlgD
MTITTSSVSSTSAASTSSTSSTSSTAGSEDRFLKLLVAQMQNQDPMNPMDNAQVTSQMAQIQTVSGIEKLNTTVGSLNSQFVQMQALQSASLVGHDVLLAGKGMTMDSKGVGHAGFQLDGAADNVKVEVLNAAGQVIDTVNLGAETSGTHSFDWTPPSSVSSTTGLTFRVSATSGAASVTTTALMRDTVDAVSTSGDTLMVELSNSGPVAYSAIKAFD